MKRLWGNTKGLKTSQLRSLENLYRRRVGPQFLISPELAGDLCKLSRELQRQIGLLINRAGKVGFVIVGDAHGILIPALEEYRLAPGRLRGVRCIHTHLHHEELTRDDLTDLALLRLDAMAAITMTKEGHPHQIHWAHILPALSSRQPYIIRDILHSHQLDIDCLVQIRALENELAQMGVSVHASSQTERALLVSITTAARQRAMDSLSELAELSRSSGIEVAETILQRRKRINARFLMGRGKLQQIAIQALQLGVGLIIFDQELNPSQIKSITDLIELKVIDRTQLILDIFAQRAQTREGKLQVELAQLHYLLPRLATKNTAMSRLTGGIGGRGPGETKLEINRRRVREKLHRIEKALKKVQKQRQQQRHRREQKGLPVISIVGYTNAGKSTLLNTLTQSRVFAEDRLFATLDPSSRRLRFPQDKEVIITDTVGFIHNLPKELMVAFRATLEELQNADLLLHVIDISNPRYAEQISAVETILAELSLSHLPQLRVLNKQDLIEPLEVARKIRQLDAMAICARKQNTLRHLVEKMATMIDTAPRSS